MSELILNEVHSGLLYLTLNRAEKKNALTQGMYETLTRMLADADQDPEIRAIHITGSGDSFCAGNDIADFLEASRAGQTVPPGQAFLLQLHKQQKPVVAAVNGMAIGIGVTMLLHCDLVYAAKGISFRLPFVDLALVPEGGSSALLPQMLGHRKAAELLLACEPFNSDQAERYGIVNRVFPAGSLLAESSALAERLARKPAAALCQAKAMLKQNIDQPLEQVIVSEIREFMARLNESEAQKILQNYLTR